MVCNSMVAVEWACMQFIHSINSMSHVFIQYTASGYRVIFFLEVKNLDTI